MLVLYSCVRACVCMCMCMHPCGCACQYTCLQKPGEGVWYLPLSLSSLIPCDRIFCELGYLFFFCLGWLVNKPQQSPCLCTPLPEHWAYMHDARLCIGLLGLWAQVLRLPPTESSHQPLPSFVNAGIATFIPQFVTRSSTHWQRFGLFEPSRRCE